MWKLLPIFFVLIISVFISCNDTDLLEDETISREDTYYEVADSVEILYSDSAVVRVRIKAPLLYNYIDAKVNTNNIHYT
ncbi:MAG: hypothetical protein HC803_05525 [Saprospiraceae bacterium]|nr:hypothetical protein [Saprospiraceae bacterium]